MLGPFINEVGVQLFLVILMALISLVTPIGMYVRFTYKDNKAYRLLGSFVTSLGLFVQIVGGLIVALCVVSEGALEFFTGLQVSTLLEAL